MMRSKYFSIVAVVFISVGALFGAGLFALSKGSAPVGFQTGLESDNRQLANLEASVSDLTEEISMLKRMYAELRDAPPEAVQREIIRAKSQDQLLQEAVAEVTPAVVSLVVTKDVPLLEVEYINPFGDDPSFRDFGFRVPVYRQRGTQEQRVGAGTGFLFTENGYILTNRHVVSDPEARYTALLSDGRQRSASVIFRDQALDLALLKIEGSGYAHASLGDSSNTRLGQSVFAIGNALGEYSNSVSTGIISGFNRTIRAQDNTGRVVELQGVLQTDAAINPGNSGGPLTTLDGKVVGVNVATVIGSQNISFAIPINDTKSIVERYIGSSL